ncbi:MAG: hypothetical protein LBM99_05320, partial [Bacillales bacterium]|nr:hypothetical protein [Bacillales bacterium]
MKKKIFILFVLSVVILSSVGVFFLLWHSITINLFDKNQHLIEVRKQKILGNDFEITLSKDPIGYSFLYFEDDNTSRTFKGSFKNNSTIKAYFDYQRLEMPIISLYTEEDEEILSNEDYTKTSVNVLNCPEENVLNNVKAGIRLRGNSTKGAPKHPYRLKFDKKENLLG